jgi:hypothetical protein
MKTYHVIPKTLFDTSHNSFLGSHYIDLVDGNILICVLDFRSDSHRDNFLKRAGVISLPHPVFETATPLNQKHVDALTAVKGITTASTVVDVAKAVGAINPGMRLF